MAVFFIVFCSCPVKKYIRMQLYKQMPFVETTTGDKLSTSDVKDCTIADRNDQSQTVILSFLHHLPTPVDPVTFFIPAVLSLLVLFLYRQDKRAYIIPRRTGIPVPIPIYLRMRHLQV
jgi:hypothetical protein